MLKVKYTKLGRPSECFERVMEIKEVLLIKPVVKMIEYLLAIGETFLLFVARETERWEIFYSAS